MGIPASRRVRRRAVKAKPQAPVATPGLRTIATALRERGEAPEKSRRPSSYERLLTRLCREHKGTSLEERYEAREEHTRDGACLHLVDRLSPFQLPLAGRDAIEQAVLSELRLIRFIGPATAARLHSEGIGQVLDLLGHVRFGDSAAELIDWWKRRDLLVLHDHIRRRLSSGSDLGVLLAGLARPGQLVALDLETLGFSGAQVFLFGLAYVSGNGLEIHQYLARTAGEEVAALSLGLEQLDRCEAIVSFNGRTADVPWLRQRCAFYGLGPVPERMHLDLLYPARRRYLGAQADGRALPDCRLPTLESHVLGVERDMDDLEGSLVPYFYKEYERRENIGPLIPIIDHNRADLAAVAKLLGLMAQDATQRL